MTKLVVKAGGASYPIHLQRGVLGAAGPLCCEIANALPRHTNAEAIIRILAFIVPPLFLP